MSKKPAYDGPSLFDEPSEAAERFWCRCGTEVVCTRPRFWCPNCQKQLKYYELFQEEKRCQA